MIRDYEDGVSDTPVLFVGAEVEHTPHYGKKTLFVVGFVDAAEVVDAARAEGVRHVYLAANHSYCGNEQGKWIAYMSLIRSLMIDVDITVEVKAADANEQVVSACRALGIHLMIGVPIRGYHEGVTVKIDDVDFNTSNPGVWCYNPAAGVEGFTPWTDYGKDKVIK